jgi:hypothetical protein
MIAGANTSGSGLGGTGNTGLTDSNNQGAGEDSSFGNNTSGNGCKGSSSNVTGNMRHPASGY